MIKIEIFGKIKGFASEYTKAFISIFAGFVMLIISAVYHSHALAQLDMICKDFVWNYPPMTNLGYAWVIPQHPLLVTRLADQFFQDGVFFQTTYGNAYDFFLSLTTLTWVLAIVGMFFIMLGFLIYFRANYLDFKNLLLAQPEPKT